MLVSHVFNVTQFIKNNRFFRNFPLFYKSFFLLAIVLSFFLRVSLSEAGQLPSKDGRLPAIAITQIVSHPSLDKVYKGIIDALELAGFKDGITAHINFANAHGHIATASQIARKFIADKPDVIVAIATPSAQAIKGLSEGAGIPLVFATVTDPISARLVKSLKEPGGYTTGTRNPAAVKEVLAFIRKSLPKVKTIGIIINYSEENSVELLHRFKEGAQEMSLHIAPFSVPNSSMVPQVARSMVAHVDAVVLLQDNTVASALPALMTIFHLHGIPAISTYLEALSFGAVAALAYDEYKIGKQTGEMVARILKGEKAKSLPVEDPTELETCLNMEQIEHYKLSLEPALIEKAIKIPTKK